MAQTEMIEDSMEEKASEEEAIEADITATESDSEGEGSPTPSEAEKRAMGLGWKPKEEFFGDPANHMSAEKFLRRNDLEEKDKLIDRLMGRLQEKDKTFEEFMNFQKNREKRAYDKAKTDIERQLNKAREEGDADKLDALYRERDELKEDEPPADTSSTKGAPRKEEVPPEFMDWVSDNKWYEQSPRLRQAAEETQAWIEHNNPGMSFEETLKLTTERVREDFYDHPYFRNTNRERAPAVETKGGNARQPRSSKNWDGLPSEAKEMFARFTKEGLYANDKKGREEYAKEFYEEREGE